MITWTNNRTATAQTNDYPIIEVLRECRRAAGLDLSKHEGYTLSLKSRVLFIEDDADTREMVWHVLTRANYEVRLAENADQGALLAQAESFDLYMIDNWMPGTSGVDLCIRLRSLNPHIPVLFFSGAAYEEDKREAMAAGAQDYLTKPAAIDELLAVVSRLTSDARRSHSIPLPANNPDSRLTT
jgi:DNA-binding response OmpR family regulator